MRRNETKGRHADGTQEARNEVCGADEAHRMGRQLCDTLYGTAVGLPRVSVAFASKCNSSS